MLSKNNNVLHIVCEKQTTQDNMLQRQRVWGNICKCSLNIFYPLLPCSKYILNIDSCKRCRNYSIETLEPVIIHHSNQKADLFYVFWRDIKHNGLIIDWIQSVPLCWRLPLLQSATVTHQWNFHIWIYKKWHKQEKWTWFTFGIPVGCCSHSQYQILITRCTSDIHGLEVASLYHGNGQSARSRQVTKWKHQIPKVHIILKDTKNIYSKMSLIVYYSGHLFTVYNFPTNTIFFHIAPIKASHISPGTEASVQLLLTYR